MPKYPTSRVSVYSAIDEERDYQNNLWKDTPDENHTPDEFLTYIRVYLRKAEEIATILPKAQSDAAVLRSMRKIAAMCIACMEQNGVYFRGSDPSWLRISKPNL